MTRGLSVDAIREMRKDAAALRGLPKDAMRTKAVDLVKAYLEDPRQADAREAASQGEGEDSRRRVQFMVEWIASGAVLDDAGSVFLTRLLNAARERRDAFEAVRPVIAALMDAGQDHPALRAFIADYFAGRLKRRNRTRSRTSRDWVRQEQLAQPVFALQAAGVSENMACEIVLRAAREVSFPRPKMAGYELSVDHIRRAARLSRGGLIGRITDPKAAKVGRILDPKSAK